MEDPPVDSCVKPRARPVPLANANYCTVSQPNRRVPPVHPPASAVSVRPCVGWRAWRAFERVPELLVGGEATFVPPVPGSVRQFGRRHHEFTEHGRITGYLAWRNGRPVGRIAAILNRTHNTFHGDRTGFFGFFDFTDAEVARLLLAAVRRELAPLGCDRLRGPVNPSQNDSCGVQVEGFGARPCFGMPGNPPGYGAVYEAIGLRPAMDMLAYDLEPSLEPGFAARMDALTDRLRARLPFTVRPVNLNRLDEEAPLVSRLFNESLRHEWNFMPLTPPTAKRWAQQLSGQLDPESVLIIEMEGVPAGLSIILPDLNAHLAGTHRWPEWARLLRLGWRLRRHPCLEGRLAVFGILPEFRKSGATLLLVHDAIRRGQQRFVRGELSWTQATNVEVNRLAEQLGLRPARRYRMYEAPMHDAPPSA